jgi:parvulin-like peptidyl-prolyl isomerase
MASRELRRAKQRKVENVSDTIEKRHESHPLRYAMVVIVLVVVVVTFVLAGPGGPLTRGMGGGSNIVFGSYMGKDITYYPGGYFAQERDRLANQYRSSTANQDTRAVAQAVWYQAFFNTAEHIAILTQAEQAGIQVSEDAVDKALLSYPAYLDDNGKFSESRYTAASASEKADTRRLMREGMETSIFATDIQTGVKTGSREVEFIKGMARQERSFSFASLPFASYPVEEVRKYGEANKSRFIKIKLSRILVKSGESQANEIRKKILDKTSTFEELAKTYSKDEFADKGGDMGWRYAYDVQADFEAKDTAQKVFALKAGELSDVLKGTFGSIIYRCDSEALDPDFTNASVLDDVKAYITRYEKGKIEDYFNERAGQLSRRAAEIGFDRAAKDMGLKVVPTEFFPVNLSNVFSFAPMKANPDTDTPANASNSEEFFLRAFSLGKDQVSSPVLLDNQIVVLKLTAERQLPDTTLDLLDSWISYAAGQSIQSDLYQVLMTPDKFADNFPETFDRYVMPTSVKQ